MLCEVCEAEEATFTLIPVGEGMPQMMGPACFARSGLEFAKAVLPAEEIAQVLGPMFVQGTGPSATAETETASGESSQRRPRKGRKVTEPPPEEPKAEGEAGAG